MRKFCQLDDNRGSMAGKLSKELGDRRDIKFQKSKYLGDEWVKISHNRIFLNSTKKDQFVSQMGEPNMGVGRGGMKVEIRVEEVMVEWEENLLTNFMQVINPVAPMKDIQDGWCWNNSPTKPFSIKEAYNLLKQNHGQLEDDIFNII